MPTTLQNIADDDRLSAYQPSYVSWRRSTGGRPAEQLTLLGASADDRPAELLVVPFELPWDGEYFLISHVDRANVDRHVVIPSAVTPADRVCLVCEGLLLQAGVDRLRREVHAAADPPTYTERAFDRWDALCEALGIVTGDDPAEIAQQADRSCRALH